jgi:single-strand DNA-binding protein
MIEFKIIGNLGADAVLNTANARPIINFAVCHSESWRKRNGEEKKYWVDCAYFIDNPELLALLKKGSLVYVAGTPNVGVHVPKGGDPIGVQYLRVSKVEILSKKKREEETTSA